MPRRFNYTNRKKINQADTSFRIEGEGPSLRFEASLKLADYKLNPKGRIFVEAYRGVTAHWQRYSFGQIASPVTPMIGSLLDFTEANGILFRVKIVVEDEGIGRLLAIADQIRPKTTDGPDPAKSLLDTHTQELFGEAWRLDWTDGIPLLLIDPKAGGKEYARDPAFRALVAPAVFREILTEYLLVQSEELPEEDEESETDIRSRWVRFSRSFNSNEFPGFNAQNIEDRRIWIDDVVAGFARRAGMFDKYFQPAEQENSR